MPITRNAHPKSSLDDHGPPYLLPQYSNVCEITIFGDEGYQIVCCAYIEVAIVLSCHAQLYLQSHQGAASSSLDAEQESCDSADWGSILDNGVCGAFWRDHPVHAHESPCVGREGKAC